MKQDEGQEFYCKECDYGRMQENIYKVLKAQELQFKCPQCKSKLDPFHRENALTEDEIPECRKAIQDITKRLNYFKDYIIPPKFFGPGHLSAYVGLTS